jgi:hypothetical protein
VSGGSNGAFAEGGLLTFRAIPTTLSYDAGEHFLQLPRHPRRPGLNAGASRSISEAEGGVGKCLSRNLM